MLKELNMSVSKTTYCIVKSMEDKYQRSCKKNIYHFIICSQLHIQLYL